MFDGTIESLQNKSSRPHTKHPNAHTAEEWAQIAMLLKERPDIGYAEALGELRQKYAYKRTYFGFYRFVVKNGLRPHKVIEKRENKPYDTPEMLGIKMQMDVKYVPLDCNVGKFRDERFYQYSIIDEATRERLCDLIGERDELVSVGEPFGLWAVEKKGNISEYIKEGSHNISVVLTSDIDYYKKRKVRVLNGSHTNLVPAGLWYGKETVYDCMTDKKLSSFVSETLSEEIIPFVSDDVKATEEFAESVKERFLNPFLNHQLTSIALNAISKWRARDLPSFKDYYEKYGKIPRNLTIGFSYLMATYKSVKKGDDGNYYVELPTRTVELKDNIPYLEYFVGGGCVIEFMKDEKVWGEDLTKYEGFAETVKRNIKAIRSGDFDLLK